MNRATLRVAGLGDLMFFCDGVPAPAGRRTAPSTVSGPPLGQTRGEEIVLRVVPPRSRRASLSSTTLLAVLASNLVRADEPRRPCGSLLWSAPAGCPERATVEVEIERLLNRSLASAWPVALCVRADVRLGRRGGFRATIETRSGEHASVRTLEGRDCTAVWQATALLIALAIDPTVTAEAERPAAHADVTALQEPQAQLEAAVSPTREPAGVPEPTERPWRLVLRGMVAAEAGAIPAPSAGLGAAIGALGRRARLEVAFGYWFERRATVPGDTSVGGDFGFYAGAVRACLVPAASAAWLSLCGGGEVGRIHGSGFGVDRPDTARALWIAPLAGAFAAIGLSATTALLCQVDAAFPLVRPDFQLGDSTRVFRPAAFSLRASLGLEARFR